MKKTIITISIIAVVAVFGWFGYQQFWGVLPMAEQLKTSGEVMRVAKYYWPGQFWIEIAHANGWFAEAGLNVELVDANPDYFQSLSDTAEGIIDINNFAIFDIVSFNSRGDNLVLFINADESAGVDALVGRQEIETVADLHGKTVGVSRGTYTDYMLDVVLERHGVKDATKVPISNDLVAPEEFSSGAFDAVLTWEPVVSEVVGRGGRIIWRSSEIPGISPNGQAARREFLEQRFGDVQAYVRVWNRTTKFIQEHPNEAFGIISKIYDVPVREVVEFARLNRILDVRDNQTVFSYASGFESLHGTARKINDFMIVQGLTDKRLDSTEFLDSRFIRALE
jgi:NitT/TauT family transport system substrate-binding protein